MFRHKTQLLFSTLLFPFQIKPAPAVWFGIGNPRQGVAPEYEVYGIIKQGFQERQGIVTPN
jgi:hypothetical protein